MKLTFALILAAALAAPVHAGEKSALTAEKPPKTAAAPEPVKLAGEGKRIDLPGGGWFTWKFDKKPRLGTAFVKVQVYSKDRTRTSSCEVTGEAGMPSMPYHDTGPVKFRLNKKGDYLLPVDVVMAGEWRVVIRIKMEGKEVYAGKVDFNV